MSDNKQEIPHRRYLDNVGNVNSLEVIMALQSQEQELRNISHQVSRISAIEDAVNELKFKVSAIPDVTEEVRLVSWHEKLIKILGTVSIISIPALFSWAAMLQTQVSDIRSDLKVANVKIEFLANKAGKVSNSSGTVAPTTSISNLAQDKHYNF